MKKTTFKWYFLVINVCDYFNLLLYNPVFLCPRTSAQNMTSLTFIRSRKNMFPQPQQISPPFILKSILYIYVYIFFLQNLTDHHIVFFCARKEHFFHSPYIQSRASWYTKAAQPIRNHACSRGGR